MSASNATPDDAVMRTLNGGLSAVDVSDALAEVESGISSRLHTINGEQMTARVLNNDNTTTGDDERRVRRIRSLYVRLLLLRCFVPDCGERGNNR